MKINNGGWKNLSFSGIMISILREFIESKEELRVSRLLYDLYRLDKTIQRMFKGHSNSDLYSLMFLKEYTLLLSLSDNIDYDLIEYDTGESGYKDNAAGGFSYRVKAANNLLAHFETDQKFKSFCDIKLEEVRSIFDWYAQTLACLKGLEGLHTNKYRKKEIERIINDYAMRIPAKHRLAVLSSFLEIYSKKFEKPQTDMKEYRRDLDYVDFCFIKEWS